MAFHITWNCVPHNIVVQILSNLAPANRALASSTCKAWREAYFAPCLWNDVQLCYDQTFGWESCKKFVSSCGWAFRQVSFFPIVFNLGMFDENGFLLRNAAEEYRKSVDDLSDVLDLMSVSKYMHRLQIKFPDDVMGSWADVFDMDFFPEDTIERIWNSICTILNSSSCMESLELGFHVDILGKPERLQLLQDTCSHTLKTLHCIAVDLTFDEILPSVAVLRIFTKLRDFHLNISYVTDDLLDALSAPDHCPVEVISILCTCIENEINDESWTSDTKWQKLKRHSRSLCVNICIYWPGIEAMKCVLKPVLPLHGLSVMCDDEQLSPSFANHVRTHFKETLVNLQLHTCTGMPIFNEGRSRLDSQPLQILAEQCLQLRKLIITGFKMFYADIMIIAEARKDLAFLDIAHDSIVYIKPARQRSFSDVDWLDNRDDNEESEEGRENRLLRDVRKVELIDRVSHAFRKKWKPMNIETTALSYWSFLDDNLIPYQEDTHSSTSGDDRSDIETVDRYQNDTDASTSIDHKDGVRRETDEDAIGRDKAQLQTDRDGELKINVHVGHQIIGVDVANRVCNNFVTIHRNRRTYGDYKHAIHLAAGSLIACKVKPTYSLPNI